MPYCIWLRGSHCNAGIRRGKAISEFRKPEGPPPPSWARKPVLHLRCVTQLTLVCILRYSGCSSLPIQSSVCYDIQNGSLCRSSFLYATLFQNASLCRSGVLYATLFKMLPFTNLIALRNSPQPGQGAIAPASVPLLASFLLSGLNAQPRLRILAGSASAGGVCFLDGGNLRCWKKSSCLSDAGVSSGFFSAVLADSRHLRSQPPTKPQTGQYPEPRRPVSHQTVQSPTTSRRSPPSQPSSAALMAQQPSNSTKKRLRTHAAS